MTAIIETLALLGLIFSLGSPVYKEREQSAAFMLAVGPPALPFLAWGEHHADPEIAWRCKRLLQHWYAARSERAIAVAKVCWPALPWIDCLPHNYPERAAVIERYLDLGRQACSLPHGALTPDCYQGVYLEYRLATVYFWRDLLAARKSPQCVR